MKIRKIMTAITAAATEALPQEAARTTAPQRTAAPQRTTAAQRITEPVPER